MLAMLEIKGGKTMLQFIQQAAPEYTALLPSTLR
jgi:hypothetical protein